MDADKGSKKDDAGDAYVVASVDRAIQLLVALAERPDTGVTELAEATGTTKSLTFRLLFTLERRGFVRKDAERRTYALGYRALLLGDQTRRQSHLIGAAEPVLADLSDRTRENALLLVRDGLQSMCIALRESPQPLRIFAAVGRLGPLYAGGGPKILLAHAPPEVLDAILAEGLQRFTEATVVDADRLRASLDQVRREGIAFSIGELDANTFSIAAPVRDHTGAVVASISVNGPSARLDGGAEADVRAAVREAADRLSRLLGWTGAARGLPG